MKNYHVITLFPEFVENFCGHGVLGQAQKNKILKVHTVNPRDYTTDAHRTVDDRPFGGGDGMLMLAEPIEKALHGIANRGKLIYFSPQGKLFNDLLAQEFSKEDNLVLLCGRYAGVDYRFIKKYVDIELSVGDYVLSGGELAASVFVDACARFVPGVLGNENSAFKDSITLNYLEAPSFTRPREWQGMEVPEVLLTGHHQNIENWKKFIGILVTLKKRPDLFKVKLSPQEKKRLKEFYLGLSIQEKSYFSIQDLEGEIECRT